MAQVLLLLTLTVFSAWQTYRWWFRGRSSKEKLIDQYENRSRLPSYIRRYNVWMLHNGIIVWVYRLTLPVIMIGSILMLVGELIRIGIWPGF